MASKADALEATASPDQVSTTQPRPLTTIVTVGNIPTNIRAPIDVVEVYNQILQNNPDLAMSVAAIESLIEVLRKSTETTVAGTLVILQEQCDRLKDRKNPISTTAGCELFMRYILKALRTNSGNIEGIKQYLINNVGAFKQNAEIANRKISNRGRFFIREGTTIMTFGGSRRVGGILLRAAAPNGGPRGEILNFKVIYVMNKVDEVASQEIVDELRAKGIPVAQVSEAAVGYCMRQVKAVFVGAEGVVENGGIISRLGTYQIGVVAKEYGRPFYVAAETYKFVRIYPLTQQDIPVDQEVVSFKTADDIAAAKGEEKEEKPGDPTDYFDTPAPLTLSPELGEFVDYTYIDTIITEQGPLTVHQVSQYLITIYA